MIGALNFISIFFRSSVQNRKMQEKKKMREISLTSATGDDEILRLELRHDANGHVTGKWERERERRGESIDRWDVWMHRVVAEKERGKMNPVKPRDLERDRGRDRGRERSPLMVRLTREQHLSHLSSWNFFFFTFLY